MAHLALILVGAIYALFYVGIKWLVTDMSPLDVFTLRLLLATPLLFLIERLFFKTRLQSFSDGLKIVGLGIIGILLVQSTVALGLKYTTVTHTGLITGASPLLTLLFSVAMKKETLNWLRLVGILVSFTGLSLLLFAHPNAHWLPPNYLLGDALILINIVLWALFLILCKSMLLRYPPFSLTTWCFVSATVILLPLIPLMHQGQWPTFHLSATAWQWMAFIVLCSTIGTYFLYFYALSKLSASVCALYVYLQPVMTMLTGAWLMREPLMPSTLSYGALIIAGVFIANESYKPVMRLLAKSST